MEIRERTSMKGYSDKRYLSTDQKDQVPLEVIGPNGAVADGPRGQRAPS